jgi:hypothetical protein
VSNNEVYHKACFCFWQNFVFWATKKNPWDMYKGVLGAGGEWHIIGTL